MKHITAGLDQQQPISIVIGTKSRTESLQSPYSDLNFKIGHQWQKTPRWCLHSANAMKFTCLNFSARLKSTTYHFSRQVVTLEAKTGTRKTTSYILIQVATVAETSTQWHISGQKSQLSYNWPIYLLSYKWLSYEKGPIYNLGGSQKNLFSPGCWDHIFLKLSRRAWRSLSIPPSSAGGPAEAPWGCATFDGVAWAGTTVEWAGAFISCIPSQQRS